MTTQNANGLVNIIQLLMDQGHDMVNLLIGHQLRNGAKTLFLG